MTRAVELAQVASDGVSEAFKNRIINGAMVIDQRNAGASVTITSNSTYTLDRWVANMNQASKFSVQQNAGSVTPPAGFTNYLGVTSLSAYSIGSSDILAMSHNIEGLNVADFAWGTANAKTVTLSFWVRSSLTGTFGGALRNSATNRSYPFTYTINSVNTWEYETITIPGDTSGTWLTNNDIGIRIAFGLGVGSSVSGTAGSWSGSNLWSATGATSVVGTNGATFYITGVQLEVGSQATSFETRSYGTELALCQRYYETAFPVGTAVSPGASYFWYTNVTSYSSTACRSQWIDFKSTKRALPTVTPYRTNIVASNDNSWAVYTLNGWNNSSSVTNCYSTHHGFYAEVTSSDMGGIGYSYLCIGAWAASAEL
jgi:hypothetical protein